MNIVLLDISGNLSIAGGAEKVLCNMANELCNRNHRVSVISFYEGYRLPFYPLNNNVKFINAGSDYKTSKLLHKLKTFMIFDKAKRHYKRDYFIMQEIGNIINTIINEINPDIIIAFNKPSGFLVKDVLKINKPMIVSLHSTPDAFLSGESEILLNKFLEKCECITVLLTEYIDVLKKYIKPRKVVCLPNCVPQYDINCYDRNNKKVIINVARIDRHAKRQHLLIEAFALISNRFKEWNVQIWGDYSRDKEYYLQLCKLIKEYALDEQIKLCGVTDNVEKIYSYSSIFAFPSLHEGFPLAMTEAMSAGIPCIGYKSASGVNSLIKDGYNGYLVNDGIIPFAEALEKLMENEELREEMGKNAKEDMKRYSPEIIWDKWEKLIYEVVNDKKE